jgi:hypothetical protein
MKKHYLVWGETGPLASDFIEELVWAPGPDAARAAFIRTMKKDKVTWERMGDHNVHVNLEEYVMLPERKEVVAELTRNFDLDGVTLADFAAHLQLYEEMIVSRGGIVGSGFISEEEYGYDGGFEIVVKFRRLENDAEFAARIKAERIADQRLTSAKIKKDEKDRREYARLKKKFG